MHFFQPFPFLGNAHVQTVLGTLWAGKLPRLESRRRQVFFPGGDALLLHDSQPAERHDGAPAALLVHGLGGSHASGYMVRLTAALVKRGFRVVRMDLRGAGAGANLSRKVYHGGCSSDVRAAALEIGLWCPHSPLTIIGMSLGGNIALKLAGEAAGEPIPNLAKVAAVAPPIDMERCSALLSKKRNRLYEKFFVHNLINQVRCVHRHFPDLPPVRFPRGLTLNQFDELYTAPRGGFASALDYYRRCSALPLLEQIQVPTFILTARDDPFIAVGPFDGLAPRPDRTMHIADRGGHLGFLGWDGAGGVRWAEQRVIEWVTEAMPSRKRTVGKPEEEQEQEEDQDWEED